MSVFKALRAAPTGLAARWEIDLKAAFLGKKQLFEGWPLLFLGPAPLLDWDQNSGLNAAPGDCLGALVNACIKQFAEPSLRILYRPNASVSLGKLTSHVTSLAVPMPTRACRLGGTVGENVG